MTREQRAHEIVDRNQLVRSGESWLVPSLTSDRVYRVELDEQGELRCNCADFRNRRLPCKHILSCAIANAQTVTA